MINAYPGTSTPRRVFIFKPMKQTHALTFLAALLLTAAGLFAFLTGCSQEGQPLYETAADIDPALNQPTTSSTQQTPSKQTPAMAQPDNKSDSKTDKPTDANTTPADDPIDYTASDKVQLTDDQWRAVLSEQEFYILRRSGTEYAGTGRYLDNDLSDRGFYHCAGCANKLYAADHKFHSGCGWPSFFKEIEEGAIIEYEDRSAGMVRVEMRCARCDGHLGHIFPDGFGTPTGMRHCVNGGALVFVPEDADVKEVFREHRKKYADK